MDNPAIRLTKRAVRRALRRCGYELRRAPREPVAPDVWPWLRAALNVRTLVDIGAHTGEFAGCMIGHLRPSATYVFEPLPWCLPALRARVATWPNARVFGVALSDHFGTAVLHENAFRPASSLLPVTALDRVEFPRTAQPPTPIEVQVARLDDLLDGDALEDDVLVKIDVQGVEDRVIRGGWKVIGRARCVMVEMSFVALYEGQPLFEEVHDLLAQLGFRLAGLRNQIASTRTGQPLFAHAIYLRNGAAGLP